MMNRIIIARRVTSRYFFDKSPTYRNITASYSIKDVFLTHYDDVVLGMCNDSEIMVDVLEDLVNSQKIQVEDDGIYFRNIKLV